MAAAGAVGSVRGGVTRFSAALGFSAADNGKEIITATVLIGHNHAYDN